MDLPAGVLQTFTNLDTAAVWCDDQLLLKAGYENDSATAMDPNELLSDLIDDQNAVSVISRYFEQLTVSSGDVLFEQGLSGDSLYLILGGSISIIIDHPCGKSLTVRTMRAGSILGEMAVYTGSPRSASAHAQQDCVLYCLRVEDYHKLVLEHPAEAGLFSSYIVTLMSERLGRANKAMLALTR